MCPPSITIPMTTGTDTTTWASEHMKWNAREQNIMKVTRFLIPKIPGIEHDIGKVFNLYRFFTAHLDTSPAVLAAKITEDNKPLFTPENVAYIQNVISKQRGAPVQRGGGAVGAVEDPTRTKFWDKLIKKVTHTIQSYTTNNLSLAQLCKNWEFYVFFLYSLEQMELIGPFVSTALDTMTLSLPVLSDLASDVIQSMFMLLPVPYAPLAGEVLGYVVGTAFLLFAIMLNMNRKHFGSAFKVSLEVIPMIGDVLAEAAVNFEIAMERAMASRGRLLGSVQRLSPTAYSIADYYVPSVDIKSAAPPADISSKNTYRQIGQDLQQYAETRLPAPVAAQLEKVGDVASDMLDVAPAFFDAVTSLASPSAMAAAVVNKAAARTANAAAAVVNKAATRTASMAGAGRRTRRRPHKRNKSRTCRK